MESSANPAGSTIGGYTFVERTWAVDNDKDVTHIGASSNVAFSCVLKILKRNSAGNYDIVVSESHSHGGTGWEDHELASPFTVPSTGEYHVALYFAAGPTIPANSTTRAYKAGDVTGTGQTGFGEDTSNCPALRVTYAAGLDDMEAWLEAVALPAEPDTIDFYGVRTDNEAITVNNDLIVKASIDGGSTFATGTIEDVGTAGVYTVFRVIGIDVSSQTGTSLVGRIETANGKNIEINATFMRGY